MVSFFPPHTILGVGKNHDLENKKWVTRGDARARLVAKKLQV